MSDNLELYELFPHFKICFSQIKSGVIKCSIRKTCKCWSLNYGTIIEKGWKFNHVDAFQLERRFKLHSSVTSDLTRKKKKSPWFSLWQHRLITCKLDSSSFRGNIFSSKVRILIFKADGNPLSANMWFIITIDKTWRDMTAVHVMGTHPKAFHMIHSQPANSAEVWQIHFQGTTNDHLHTDRVLAAAFSTAATTTAVLHWPNAVVVLGWRTTTAWNYF